MEGYRLSRLGLYCLFFAAVANAEPAAQLNSLPFLKKAETLKLKEGISIPIRMKFEPGWGLNPNAPSWMALLEVGADQSPQVVEEWRGKQLTPSAILKPLSSGKTYRLRGTFYYCQKSANSACRVESRNYLVSVGTSPGALTSIEIRLPGD